MATRLEHVGPPSTGKSRKGPHTESLEAAWCCWGLDVGHPASRM